MAVGLNWAESGDNQMNPKRMAKTVAVRFIVEDFQESDHKVKSMAVGGAKLNEEIHSYPLLRLPFHFTQLFEGSFVPF